MTYIAEAAPSTETPIFTCLSCDGEHEGSYSHEGRFDEGAIFAVICTVDNPLDLTAYYTEELLVRYEPRPTAASLGIELAR